MKEFKEFVNEVKPLYAWMDFHAGINRASEPADIARKIQPLLGSDFGESFTDREWQKALTSAPHMRTLLYKAMNKKYGDDPTQGTVYS